MAAVANDRKKEGTEFQAYYLKRKDEKEAEKIAVQAAKKKGRVTTDLEIADLPMDDFDDSENEYDCEVLKV